MLKIGVSQKIQNGFRSFQFSEFSMNSIKTENHTKQTKLIKNLILRFV